MLNPVFASFEVWTKEVYHEDRSGVGAAGPLRRTLIFAPDPPRSSLSSVPPISTEAMVELLNESS